MKSIKHSKTLSLFILLFVILTLNQFSFAQVEGYWNSVDGGYNIYNINGGNVGIGSFSYQFQPAWKLHVLGDIFANNLYWGQPYPQNSKLTSDEIEFITGAGTTFKLNSPTYYNHALQFQYAGGVNKLGIEFWSFGSNDLSLKHNKRFYFKDGTNPIFNVIDFYANYNNPNYDQLAIKSDNTVSWGNDWSWLSADGWNGFQGPGINLNKAGTNLGSTPFIDFNYGASYPALNHIDVRIKNSAPNTLDFWTNMDFYGNGGTKVMTINNNGVLATKITVQSTWSDFVFKPDYKLKSLTEVEKYIKENGHLEGLPTEQEVKDNGVELGDATSKLLQKVEELTLYVIEQKKEIERLKEACIKPNRAMDRR